jgi:hypothetical protein
MVADFLRAVGSAGLPSARRHVAVHWAEELGGEDNALAQLAQFPHLLNLREAEIGEAEHDVPADRAIVQVRLTDHSGTEVHAQVHAVVERLEDLTPLNWAIAGIELNNPPPNNPPPNDTS